MPIGETDSSGEVTRWFVRGVGIAEGTGDIFAEIIGSDSSAKAIFYVSNHRGDTMLVLAENGNIESQIRYDAFGNVKSQTGNFTPTYTFSTKEYLSDAKLYLYAYRVYDPIAGRWTQRDPIDYQDSVNLYQFCGNNPVNAWDPFGLLWYDDLADGARSFGQRAKNFMSDNTHWTIAGTINTVFDVAIGIASTPEAIGHLGEGSGTFAGNPTLDEKSFWYAIWEVQHLADPEHIECNSIQEDLKEALAILNNVKPMPTEYIGKRPR